MFAQSAGSDMSGPCMNVEAHLSEISQLRYVLIEASSCKPLTLVLHL
jgi:hypothetical protein